MTRDALDPGPLGDYPAWPRLPSGEPDPERMPQGLRRHKDPTTGRWIVADVTNYDPATGEAITPPTIP